MTTETQFTVLEAPLGEVVAAWNDDGVVSIRLGPDPGHEARARGWRARPGARNALTEQLRAYFAGELRAFDLRVVQEGTAFQREVWDALTAIPYGETRSYTDIAAAVGRPTAVRAVGAANGRNDVPIVVPCHRVIGSAGELRGYAGGLDVKAALLRFEREGVWVPVTHAAPGDRVARPPQLW